MNEQNHSNQSMYRQPGPSAGNEQNQGQEWNKSSQPWLKTPPPGSNSSTSQMPTVHNEQPNASEQQSSPPTKSLDFESEIKKMISTAGTLEMSPEQEEILFSPVQDHHIKIKEDGSMYLPWTWYHDRLTKAFGHMRWIMVPHGLPKLLPDNLIMWGFHLVIKGVYMGFALGEMQFIPKNARMTYGEACEGAKSNALMRICKSMGISLDLWDKDFCRRWENLYAETYIERNTEKVKWQLKAGVYEKFMELTKLEKEASRRGLSTKNVSEHAVVTPVTPAIQPAAEKKPGAKKKKSEDVTETPFQEISSEEMPAMKQAEIVANAPEKLKPYISKILLCENVTQVKKVMDTIKIDTAQGHLTETEKEELRVLSNKRSVALMSKKK